MKIKVGKTYKTSGGHDVYIDCKTSHPTLSKYPYIGVYETGVLYKCNESGEHCSGVSRLLPNKVKKEGWVNIRYFEGVGFFCGKVFDTEEEAIRGAGTHPHTVVKVEWGEGE